MTTVLDAPPAAPPAPAPRRRGAALAAAAPWPLAAAVPVALLLAWHTPPAAVAGYAAYWALAVVLPGTLVHRALRGSRGNLPEDLGYGAATGLLLELAAWATAAAAGAPALVRWWAAPVVAAFALVPRLRRHWRIRDRRPLPASWSWLTAGVVTAVALAAASHWRGLPLPPATADYYQDYLYHLALVHELTRAMPFEVPQLAGEALRYHYLADAHLATAATATGLPPPTVLLRLWSVPVVVTAVLVVAALARDVAGRWWAGPVAAAVAFAGTPPVFGAPVAPFGGAALTFASPSQLYAYPLAGLLAAVAVDAVRGRPLRAGWALVPALCLACAGSKASALPPLVAGLAVAAAAGWWVRRRPPWAVLGVLAVAVAAMGAGLRLFAGGGAGTLGVQAFALLRGFAPYATTLGAGEDRVAQGGPVAPGVAAAGAAGRWFLALLVAWWLVAQAARLAGLVAPAGRGARRDPAVWLLAGTVTAGTGAAWLLYHPSASQGYFYLGVVPFGAVLTVRLLTGLAGTRAAWCWAAAAAGAAWAAAAPAPQPVPAAPDVAAWTDALTRPVVRTAGLAAAGVVLVLLAVRLRRARRGGGPGRTPAGRAGPRWAAAALVAAVLGASVAGGAGQAAGHALGDLRRGDAPPSGSPTAVTAGQAAAALWLDAHAGPDDVVATNVHCRPVPTRPTCDARAFWVAGLGGRRVLVESWGYSDAAAAAHGVGGLGYTRQPPPDPALFARNEAAFTAPTAALLAGLRADGVRWLLADARASAVSPRLADLAAPRFTAGTATVYELR